MSKAERGFFETEYKGVLLQVLLTTAILYNKIITQSLVLDVACSLAPWGYKFKLVHRPKKYCR